MWKRVFVWSTYSWEKKKTSAIQEQKQSMHKTSKEAISFTS